MDRKHFYYWWYVDAQVTNGGFTQFYYNDYGMYVPTIIKGLKQMGVPLPMFFGWVVALLETVGAVLLILGLGTRILGLLFAIDMLVAIFPVKTRVMKVGFAAQQTTGWEFDFSLLAISLALVFTGAGSIALDHLIGL